MRQVGIAPNLEFSLELTRLEAGKSLKYSIRRGAFALLSAPFLHASQAAERAGVENWPRTRLEEF